MWTYQFAVTAEVFVGIEGEMESRHGVQAGPEGTVLPDSSHGVHWSG